MASENPPANSTPASRPSRRAASPVARGSRSTARLAAVQALYQQATTAVPLAKLLHEFHQHRLAAEPEGSDEVEQLQPADRAFFDDLVSGGLARQQELDAIITRFLQPGWNVDRLDRLMLQILRCGAYEMLARPDVPHGAVVSEYVDVARAFYDRPEAGFVNALLDRLGKTVRAG